MPRPHPAVNMFGRGMASPLQISLRFFADNLGAFRFDWHAVDYRRVRMPHVVQAKGGLRHNVRHFDSRNGTHGISASLYIR